jgi:hypothetical protein
MLVDTLSVFEVDNNLNPSTTAITVKESTCLRVTEEDSTIENENAYKVLKKIKSDDSKHTPVYIAVEAKNDNNLHWLEKIFWGGDCLEDVNGTLKGSTLKVHHTYLTTREAIDISDHLRYGFTYGVLITPFKYYFMGNGAKHHIAGQTNVGGYIGYRIYERPGISNVLAFSAGPVKTTADAVDSSGNKSTVDANGASVALAWLGEFKGRFIVGVMFGKDFYEKPDGADIPINAKTWVGINLGFAM